MFVQSFTVVGLVLSGVCIAAPVSERISLTPRGKLKDLKNLFRKKAVDTARKANCPSVNAVQFKLPSSEKPVTIKIEYFDASLDSCLYRPTSNRNLFGKDEFILKTANAGSVDEGASKSRYDAAKDFEVYKSFGQGLHQETVDGREWIAVTTRAGGKHLLETAAWKSKFGKGVSWLKPQPGTAGFSEAQCETFVTDIQNLILKAWMGFANWNPPFLNRNLDLENMLFSDDLSSVSFIDWDDLDDDQSQPSKDFYANAINQFTIPVKDTLVIDADVSGGTIYPGVCNSYSRIHWPNPDEKTQKLGAPLRVEGLVDIMKGVKAGEVTQYVAPKGVQVVS